MTRALILVDLQNDFLPGGALAVPDGNAVIPVANALMASGAFDLIVATQDWHPADHASFGANHPGREVGEVIQLGEVDQILWPVHCVQGTDGAAFSADLKTDAFDEVVQKGTDARIDSYSGFFDNDHRSTTGLAELLQRRRVTDVHVMGLATDYCVKFTVLDACKLGFVTFVIEDGCRGVEVATGDCDRAFDEMQSVGATIATSQACLS